MNVEKEKKAKTKVHLRKNIEIYTPFGYGNIPEPKAMEESKETGEDIEMITLHKKDTRHVKVNLRGGGLAYIQPELIAETIEIRIKTFFGKRHNFEVKMNINCTFEELKDELVKLDEEQELASYHNIKMIYPMGKMRELLSSLTIEEVELPNNAQLILVGQKSFYWDGAYKGNDIVLNESFLTACKRQVQDFETVLGTLGFNSGRHYWEITIENYVEAEDVFLGIAFRDVNLYSPPTDGTTYWGYMPAARKKFGLFEGEGCVVTEYGEIIKAGETIGILLEFEKNNEASLTFYKNKKSLGLAYSGLKGGIYYPAVTLYYSGVQVTLNTNVTVPVTTS